MRHFTVFVIAAAVFLSASAALGGIIMVERDNPLRIEIVGDKLFLNKQSGRVAAPDGKYFLRDNSFIIIVNGRIDKAGSSALKSHPDIAAEVSKGSQAGKGLQTPGSIKKFDPQRAAPQQAR